MVSSNALTKPECTILVQCHAPQRKHGYQSTSTYARAELTAASSGAERGFHHRQLPLRFERSVPLDDSVVEACRPSRDFLLHRPRELGPFFIHRTCVRCRDFKTHLNDTHKQGLVGNVMITGRDPNKALSANGYRSTAFRCQQKRVRGNCLRLALVGAIVASCQPCFAHGVKTLQNIGNISISTLLGLRDPSCFFLSTLAKSPAKSHTSSTLVDEIKELQARTVTTTERN